MSDSALFTEMRLAEANCTDFYAPDPAMDTERRQRSARLGHQAFGGLRERLAELATEVS